MKKLFCIATIFLVLSVLLAGCGTPPSSETPENGDDSPAGELQLLNEYNLRCTDIQAEYEIVDGILYGRGYNYNMILGEDYGRFYNANVKIAENVVHVEARNGVLLYLTNDGKVYAKGREILGIPSAPDFVESFYDEPELLFEDCLYFSMGTSFVLAIKNDNSLWFLGESLNGQGAAIIFEYVSEPIKIADKVKLAKAFGYTSAWIDDKGDLYLCGDDSRNQIGNGGENGSGFPTLYKDIVETPYRALQNCVSFTVTDSTVIYAKTADGAEYMWGNHHSTSPTLKSKEMPEKTGSTQFAIGVTWQDYYGMLHSDGSPLTYYIDQSEEPPYDLSVITKTTIWDSSNERKVMKSNLVPPFQISLVGGAGGLTISSESDDCLYLLSHRVLEGGLVNDISLSVLYDHYAMPLHVDGLNLLYLAVPNSPNAIILNTLTGEAEEGEPLINTHFDIKPIIDQKKAESLALNELNIDKYRNFDSEKHEFSTVSSVEFLLKPEFIGGHNTWVSEDYFETDLGDWFWKVTVSCINDESCAMTAFIDAKYGNVVFISNN